MWFYFLIFFISILFFYVSHKYEFETESYFVLAFLLAVVASFRPADCCKDYPEYVNYYENISQMTVVQLEPAYFVISKISKLFFNSSLGVFIIYAFIGITVKAIAIKKLTHFYYLSFVLYISFYFLIHEMTQIRVGVAAGFLLLSILEIYNRNLKRFGFLIFLASLFHYSSLSFIFCYFLNPHDVKTWRYYLIIICAFVSVFLGVNIISILSLIKLTIISNRLEAYQYLLSLDINSRINLVDKLFLLRLIFACFFLFYAKSLADHNKYSILLAKMYSISAVLYIVLSPLPVLAIRMRELFGLVEIILLPLSIYTFRSHQYVPLMICIIIGFGIMCIELFNTKLVGPYF